MGHSEKYWVSKDGQNMGPFTLDQIRDQMDGGLLSAADHACEVGADEWSSVSAIA